MNDGAIQGLEISVNALQLRMTAAEAEIARLGQVIWQMVANPGGGGGSGQIKFATGAVPAKSGGVLGSATVNLFDLDASTGLLTAAGSGKAWNDGTNATMNDLVVEQDANGNWVVITEFCP